MALHWVSACQGRRGSVSSSHWTVLSLQGMRTSPFGLLTLFKLRFPFTNFHIPPPLDQDFSLKASLIKSCFPSFSSFFVPQFQERPFLSVHPTSEEKRTDWKPIEVTLSSRRGRKEKSFTFYLKLISYQDHRDWRSSEVLCHH